MDRLSESIWCRIHGFWNVKEWLEWPSNHLDENSMANWKTVLPSNQEILERVNIKRGIFQGDSLSPLLFEIIMIPLSLILRDKRAGYQLKKEGCKINHLLFMDDLKLYAKNSSQINSLVQTELLTRHRDEVWY